MTTIKKRLSVSMTEEDLRILTLIQEKTKENINATFRKALFFYYLSQVKDAK
jgi:hypothetical protein